MLVDRLEINKNTQVWHSCQDIPKIRESLDRMGKDYVLHNGRIWYINPKRYTTKQKKKN